VRVFERFKKDFVLVCARAHMIASSRGACRSLTSTADACACFLFGGDGLFARQLKSARVRLSARADLPVYRYLLVTVRTAASAAMPPQRSRSSRSPCAVAAPTVLRSAARSPAQQCTVSKHSHCVHSPQWTTVNVQHSRVLAMDTVGGCRVV
jgi:hypothetical protein